MKYRSYNSELLIGTTLMVNVFNDIIIDRRRHGLERDYSKPITLSEIVQKDIEVPCILGDRGIILKSLENEPGKYKMPLIIMQMKGVKTDAARMFDLHADIFYQQDDSFSDLEYDNPIYRPKELSKMRAQPINISYEVTIITRYREDLDQIISNFAVHFRPDIYLKWWHPSNKVRPLESQVTWGHDISFDVPVEYNPQNIFTYKGMSSFTLKSWLFYGMNATDNAIDPELESIIKTIKIFPNRTGEDDEGGNPTDVYDEDDIWAFGNYLNTSDGTSTYTNKKESFGFWGVETGQDFVGNDVDLMKQGKYAVNNVFASLYPPISGDPVISKICTNKDVGDFISTNDKLDNYGQEKYQAYLEMDVYNRKNVAEFKNVFFKGSFPQSAMFLQNPSGDFVFQRFFKSYVDNRKAKAEFGDCYNINSTLNLNYDIATKDLTLWSEYEDDKIKLYGKAKYNSQSGHFQEFEIQSKPFSKLEADQYIRYAFHREYDKEFNRIKENDITEKYNVRPIGDMVSYYDTQLLMDDLEIKNTELKIMNFIKEYWKKINLQENNNKGYDLLVEDPRAGKTLEKKGIDEVPFRKVDLISQQFQDGFYYQILANKYLYIILKANVNDQDDVDIFDIGAFIPFKYRSQYALIYEVLIPESRELLGLNFRICI